MMGLNNPTTSSEPSTPPPPPPPLTKSRSHSHGQPQSFDTSSSTTASHNNDNNNNHHHHHLRHRNSHGNGNGRGNSNGNGNGTRTTSAVHDDQPPTYEAAVSPAPLAAAIIPTPSYHQPQQQQQQQQRHRQHHHHHRHHDNNTRNPTNYNNTSSRDDTGPSPSRNKPPAAASTTMSKVETTTNANANSNTVTNTNKNTAPAGTTTDIPPSSQPSSSQPSTHPSSHPSSQPSSSQPSSHPSSSSFSSSTTTTTKCSVTPPTLLQPRVAVVLGVPNRWHPVLFGCRLLSICPAIWWSLPIALRLVVQLHHVLRDGLELSFESRLKLTETCLAMIWCGASAYLSFFFTDCLMSRWLLNYTPQASTIRLLAINALNGYVTSWVLYLSGGSVDPRLLLPAWIGIATTLTALYHITYRNVNIRKETSISISVFSGASFISMAALLVQLHLSRADFPDVPVVRIARRMSLWMGGVAERLFDVANATRDL